MLILEPNFRFYGLNNLDNNIFAPKTSIHVLDANNNVLDISPYNCNYVKIQDIPQHTIDAFVSIEDKRFFEHNGFDIRRIVSAIAKNITSLKFKEGGSTITQQLVKNTQLTPDKNIWRKVNELRIAREIERKYTKQEILEQYFNVLYFGKNIYGIGNAAKSLFGKSIKDINIQESALLAAIINNPLVYSPYHNCDNALKRRNLVLQQMLNCAKISQEEYNQSIATDVIVNSISNPFGTLSSMLMCELSKYPYIDDNSTIYTNINTDFTKLAYDIIQHYKLDDVDISMVLIDNSNNSIVSAISTNNDNLYNAKKQPGSTLKPIIAYAPAIDNNDITGLSPVLDQRTDFGNGFCPKNNNNKYRGWITIEDAIAYSSNIVAVKTLQNNGIDQSKAFANKLGIKFDNNDNGLALALGSMNSGIDLPTIVNAYSAFANLGRYKSTSIISQIHGKLSYSNLSTSCAVMKPDTAEIITDMLQNVATIGTAKNLSSSTFDVAAKTGTVGNINNNSDAYCIAYTSWHTIGVWMGGRMSNSITGGSTPTLIVKDLLNNLYTFSTPPKFASSGNVIHKSIDLSKLHSQHMLQQAQHYIDPNNKIKGKFSIHNLPPQSSYNYLSCKDIVRHYNSYIERHRISSKN
jgi:membrane peptidoglycan carboxypeptidase